MPKTPTGLEYNSVLGRLEFYFESTLVGYFTASGFNVVGTLAAGAQVVDGVVAAGLEVQGNVIADGTSKAHLVETNKALDKIGFFNATPIVQPTGYTVTNYTRDVTFAGDSTTAADAVKAVASLISDLIALGLITGTVTP